MPSLAELILECQEELRELPGTVPYRDPLPWERHLRAAADEVCRRSFCYYTTVSYDVTAGQAQVISGGCSCPLFRIEEARLSDVSAVGGFRYLNIVTPDAFPHHPCFSIDWRNYPAYGPPRALVVAGINNMRLFGAPIVTTTAAGGGGLLLTGYATINGTDGSGNQIIALTDNLPLPQRAEEAVKLGAMLRRARSYPKEYGDRVAMLREDYQDALGDLNAEVREKSAASAAVGAYA